MLKLILYNSSTQKLKKKIGNKIDLTQQWLAKTLSIYSSIVLFVFSFMFLRFKLKNLTHTQTTNHKSTTKHKTHTHTHTHIMNLSQMNHYSGHVLRKIAILSNIFSTLPGHSKLLGSKLAGEHAQMVHFVEHADEVTNGSQKK